MAGDAAPPAPLAKHELVRRAAAFAVFQIGAGQLGCERERSRVNSLYHVMARAQHPDRGAVRGDGEGAQRVRTAAFQDLVNMKEFLLDSRPLTFASGA